MFIDDLIAYCEARSPGFEDEIQGLPDIVFESYEEFVGKTLPTMYRDFQLTLGWNTGPWVFKDLTFRENELLIHCLPHQDTSFAIDIAGASRHGLRSLQAVLEQEIGTAA